MPMITTAIEKVLCNHLLYLTVWSILCHTGNGINPSHCAPLVAVVCLYDGITMVVLCHGCVLTALRSTQGQTTEALLLYLINPTVSRPLSISCQYLWSAQSTVIMIPNLRCFGGPSHPIQWYYELHLSPCWYQGPYTYTHTQNLWGIILPQPSC